MRTRRINWLLFVALTVSLGLLLPGRVTAQTFTTLHNCTGATGEAGDPQAGLILLGNTLYGTANGGGVGAGGVFAVGTDGTGFTMLYSFTGGSDGANPLGGLIFSSNTLYGTALQGGTGKGTVFAVDTNGTSFMNLHIFAGYPNDGGLPQAGLILSGNTLYGTSLKGGGVRAGTVFKVNTDGTGFMILYSFVGSSDGAYPQAGLVLSGNTLYGTAQSSGSANNGTVFAVTTNGTGFTVVHNFTALSNSTNSDGANPLAGLILSGNTLYGTASVGGSSGNGTVFAVTTNGTGFTVVHNFTALSNSTNSDGASPGAGLILWSNTLYGTAAKGGGSGSGTVFAINTNGTGFTNLHSFTADTLWYTSILGPIYTNSEGASPQAGLIISGNTLYGTATAGGSTGNGTVFSLSLGSVSPPPPQLTLLPSRTNLILTWPMTAIGFSLQSTTNLGSSANWTTNSAAPVVVNGQNTITNPISGTQRFFRLSQ